MRGQIFALVEGWAGGLIVNFLKGKQMNERIDEIALEARDHASGYWDEYSPEWFQFYNEKFAELLIRECTNMLPIDSIRDHNGKHIYYVIREYFDVPTFGG